MTTVPQPSPVEIVSASASRTSSRSRSPRTRDAMSSNGASRASESSAGDAAAVPLWKIKAAWNGRSGASPPPRPRPQPVRGRPTSYSDIAKAVTPVTPKKGVPGSAGEQLLEPLRVVERADQREMQRAAADHVLGDPLHVLGGDRVERRHHVVRLDGP